LGSTLGAQLLQKAKVKMLQGLVVNNQSGENSRHKVQHQAQPRLIRVQGGNNQLDNPLPKDEYRSLSSSESWMKPA